MKFPQESKLFKFKSRRKNNSTVKDRTLNWTNALTSYYTKLRRFSADLVGFGPVKVSHVGKPELDQICRTHGDLNKNSLESSNFEKLQDFLINIILLA